MAEILIRAKNNVHSDPDKDRRGCYKRGMPVVVMPDGHQWGLLERLPDFVVIKVPMVSSDRIEKYIQPQMEQNGFEKDGTTPKYEMHRRRLWKIRVDDLPAGARNKLANEGELTIKASADYTGSFDYTWNQMKTYFRNLKTDTDETENP